MTRDEVVTMLKARLSRFNDTTLDAKVILELKAAQSRLEGMAVLPWFLVSERATTETIAGDERVQVPDDMIREVDEAALYYRAANGAEYPLRKMDREDLAGRYAAEGDVPRAYALQGEYFRLRPVPSKQITLVMSYYKKDEVLDDDIENGWLRHYPDLLMAEAGIILAAGYTKNKEALQLFTSMRSSELDRLMRNEQARKDANYEYMREN